jgi:hypothetical protein
MGFALPAGTGFAAQGRGARGRWRESGVMGPILRLQVSTDLSYVEGGDSAECGCVLSTIYKTLDYSASFHAVFTIGSDARIFFVTNIGAERHPRITATSRTHPQFRDAEDPSRGFDRACSGSVSGFAYKSRCGWQSSNAAIWAERSGFDGTGEATERGWELRRMPRMAASGADLEVLSGVPLPVFWRVSTPDELLGHRNEKAPLARGF